jgi:hypothetical protein
MVARMVAAMGYVPDMSLSKNPCCVIPPPNSQGRFEGDADQDCGEQIEFCVAYSAMRDLGIIDE